MPCLPKFCCQLKLTNQGKHCKEDCKDKYEYDEICILFIEAILKHKQGDCAKGKTCLPSFQRNSSF